MFKKFMRPSPSQTGSSRMNRVLCDAARPASSGAVAPSAPNEDGNQRSVGRHIQPKGSEITDCETLAAEDRVKASKKKRDIRIAEGGVNALWGDGDRGAQHPFRRRGHACSRRRRGLRNNVSGSGV
ncbi:MAG: hypothetical protein IV089_04155 [Thiobacillus sp.]|nr:hypothetical protein [Thiobacillus sp.]